MNEHKIHEWEKAINRFELLAVEVLIENGYPAAYDELLIINPNGNRKILSATLIIFGIHHLKLLVEKNKMHRALDRFLSISVAYDELTFLVGVPAYDDKVVLTHDFLKHINSGIKIDKGGKKGRENRSRKASEEKVIDEINKVYAEHCNWGITTIREEVGKRLGLSARQIRRVTEHNPKKV